MVGWYHDDLERCYKTLEQNEQVLNTSCSPTQYGQIYPLNH